MVGRVGRVSRNCLLSAAAVYWFKQKHVYDFWETNLFLPIARRLPSETAHKCALMAVRLRIPPHAGKSNPSILKTNVFGIEFDNPIGLAAGFDKDCEAIKGCKRLGFGFIEVGSITPEPQSGNEKPRVFRLPDDGGLINRYGFPSKGVDAAANNLANLQPQYLKIEVKVLDLHTPNDNMDSTTNISRNNNINPPAGIPNDITANMPQTSPAMSYTLGDNVITDMLLPFILDWAAPNTCKLGINLGINKNTKNPTNDYVIGVQKLGQYSDYIVVNVSSPNTPGLRNLQRKDKLKKILLHVSSSIRRQQRATSGQACQALLLKISPDLSDDYLQEVVDLIQDPKFCVNGLIVSNTTVTRPSSLSSLHKKETGGLSGVPIKDISTNMIKKVYRMTNGAIPIIGVGGISTAEDAYEKIRAGASLVQLYTGLIYNGFGSIRRIKTGLCELLQRDGYKNVKEAVGADIEISRNCEECESV